MRKHLTIALIAALTGACDIEQTEAGALPDVDIDVSADPGSLPEYDIDWMDVDVGTTERTVEVPKVVVVMEEETISVPVIDVNMPDAGEKLERTLTVEVDVPHAGYALDIEDIYAAEGRLYVVATLEETDPESTEQKVRISDRVVLNAPDADVRYIIVGDRPEGLDNSRYQYLADSSEIPSAVLEGRRIYGKD